jgi:hypothetical protein
LLPDARPVQLKQRRVHPRHAAKLRAFLDDHVRRGLILHSTSQFSTPLAIVNKPNGDIRPVFDYRLLNAVTFRDVHPMPTVDECIDVFQNCVIYTAIDLSSAFHNVPVHPNDRHRTAFATLGQLYEWNVLPMGLSNAPPLFSAF